MPVVLADGPKASRPPPPTLGQWLDAVPFATLLLEPEDSALVAGNAEAATLLAATPGSLSRCWRDALEAGEHGRALRDRLAAVTARATPEVFDAVLVAGGPGGGRRPRDVLVRARLVEVEGRPLLSAGLVDISRRRRAEAALSAANARLEVALRGADLGAWHWDSRTGLVEVSERCATMLGLAPPGSGLQSGRWEALVHPEDLPGLRASLKAHLSGATPFFEAEARFRHRDGHWIWVLMRGLATQRDAGSRVLVMTGTLLDITARREAEQAASERAARLRALLEGSPIAMQRTAMDGRVLDANAAMLRLLGVTREDLAAGRLRWTELTAPEWRQADRAALAEARERGYCTPYEKEYLRPDGRRVPALVGYSVIDRAAGELATFALDLTAQKRAEAARVESEREARRRLAELEMLYRTTPLGLAQFDRELRYVRVNEALAEINGLPVEAHLGRSAWEVVPDLRAAAEPLMRRVIETGEAIADVEVSGETPRAPGETRHWLAHFHPIHDPGHDPGTEEVAGLGMVCEEVTERKRAERARDLLLRELDHRVKNLFAIIAGMVSFTARTAPTPEAMRAGLLGRIGALARAHDLVRPALVGGAVPGEAGGPTLAQLLEALLEPFRATRDQPERLHLAGPPVPLGQTGAPPLALVLHELATNAARHGAFAGGGQVVLEWRVLSPEEGGHLLLRWEERGGPAVPVPARGGFGLRLVAQSSAQLGGTARFDWRPEGLVVELRLPMERLAR